MSHLVSHGFGRAGQQGQEAAARVQREQAAAAIRAQQQHVAGQVALFQEALGLFADKYRADINRDPAFRHEFLRMARSIGVDPLASSKGFWADRLGVGSFFFDLAVQVADACLATRAANGGLMPMAELLACLRRSRAAAARRARGGGGGAGGAAGVAAAAAVAAAAEISEEDVRRAVAKLAVLGDDFAVVSVGGSRFVLSVPAELAAGQDSTAALQAALEGGGAGFVTAEGLARTLGWARERSQRALETLLKDGLCWLDEQGARDVGGGSGVASEAAQPRFYFLSLLHNGS